MATQLLERPTAATLLSDRDADLADRGYEHLDRCRRIRVGPALTVVFENEQTLGFRMQELAGATRHGADLNLRRLGDWYKRLLPSQDRLLAALWANTPGRRPILNLDNFREVVSGGRVALRSNTGYEIAGRLLPERVRDRLLGHLGWIEFPFCEMDRLALEDTRREWRVRVTAQEYGHESAPLSPLVQMSLLNDLAAA